LCPIGIETQVAIPTVSRMCARDKATRTLTAVLSLRTGRLVWS